MSPRKVTKTSLPDAAPLVEGTDPKAAPVPDAMDTVQEGIALGNKLMPMLKGTSGEVVAQAFLYIMFSLGYSLGMHSTVVIGVPIDEAADLEREMLGPPAEKKVVVN